ncbi:MAG: GxxExxY protein [Gemmatimonadaceae bacterium]
MPQFELIEEEVTRSVIGAFFEVYNDVGFGFLEHTYSRAMAAELEARGHHVAREVSVEITYKGQSIGRQRLDLVVDKKVIVEVKANFQLHPSAIRQVYSYLRGSGLEVGLLLHFGPEAKFYRQIYRSRIGRT